MRRAVLVVVLGLAAALGAGAALGRDAGVTFPRGTATITTATRAIALRVEIARTDEQRQQGLMGRRKLAADAGMVFQYPAPSRGAFWMKDTLVPLDIAFYDGRGRILRIMQMKPCTVDPCPLYDPQVAYRGALEVKAGSFRRWGVRRGHRIAVRTLR